jgi:hypothetical protein
MEGHERVVLTKTEVDDAQKFVSSLIRPSLDPLSDPLSDPLYLSLSPYFLIAFALNMCIPSLTVRILFCMHVYVCDGGLCRKKNEERLAELTHSIDMQQKKILQVRFSSTRKDEEKRDELSGSLIQLKLYQEEYLDIAKKEYHRFSDSIELFPLGLSYQTRVHRWKPRARVFTSLGPENPISKRSMDLPPRPPSLMHEASRPMERWTTLLNVWSAGRTWKRK